MHMYQLETLYQINGSQNSSGVIWGHMGQKVIFTKNTLTRSCYIARPWDSNMCITLRRSTYVIGSTVSLGVIWGHRGQILIFTKNALSPLCYIAFLCYSCIYISLTLSTNLLAQILNWVIWRHRAQKVIFNKNATILTDYIE